MKEELNYLSERIDYLESKIINLDSISNNFTTRRERSFYDNCMNEMELEKSLLENILNALTISQLK